MADQDDQPAPVVSLRSDIYADGTVTTDVLVGEQSLFTWTGRVQAAATVNQEAVAAQLDAYADLAQQEPDEDSESLEPETATPP